MSCLTPGQSFWSVQFNGLVHDQVQIYSIGNLRERPELRGGVNPEDVKVQEKNLTEGLRKCTT